MASLSFALVILTLLLPTCATSQCSGQRANPSVYNFALGGHPAKIISDGRFVLPTAADVYDEELYILDRAIRMSGQSTSPVALEINILYIDTGDARILFDVGNSFFTPDTAAFLFENLAVEGIDRKSITDIFLTHGHLDHLGGLIDLDGETLAFPSATVHINQVELDFWTAPDVDLTKMSLTPDFQALLVTTSQTILTNPAVQAQITPFAYNATFLSGAITAQETSWHTPGHTSYFINFGGDTLLFTGDALGLVSTSINNPWFRLRFDFNVNDGITGRVKLLDDLARTGTPIIAYHASFPGYGRVVTNDLTFDFKPFNWEFSKGVATTCASEV